MFKLMSYEALYNNIYLLRRLHKFAKLDISNIEAKLITLKLPVLGQL